MTDRELLQQALEALYLWVPITCADTIAALRERLAREDALQRIADNARELGLDYEPARQEQEPVANNWSVFNSGAEVAGGLSLSEAWEYMNPARLERGWSAVCVLNADNPPLYTAPPPREWVGLTDVERIDLGVISEAVSAHSLIGMVEAKLKEKNA